MIGFKKCARCGHVRALHWNPNNHVLTSPPVCHRFERKAPWPLRAVNWLLAKVGRS